MPSLIIYILFNAFLMNHTDVQNTQKVDYYIKYDFISIIDTVENIYGNIISFTLYHYDGESRFMQTNSIFNDSMAADFENSHPKSRSQEESQRFLDLFADQSKSWIKRVRPGGYTVQKSFNSNKFRNILEFTLPRSYLEEDMVFEWKLHHDTDTIAGQPCKMASVDYGGRKYKAWYAPSIPIPDGPYVFAGLPGLIVKISDNQEWYTFTMKTLTTIPQKRFWKENFVTRFYKKLDRKTFVDKLRKQQGNPRMPGVINMTEEQLFDLKKRTKGLLYMLLEKSD